MNMRIRTLIGLMVLAIALFAVGCSPKTEEPAETAAIPELVGIGSDQYNEVTQNDELVLVDFHAKWCKPCVEMAPDLEQLHAKYGNKLKVIKIDIDRNTDLANAFNITGVPTIKLYNKGELVYDRPGKLSSSALENLVSPYVTK